MYQTLVKNQQTQIVAKVKHFTQLNQNVTALSQTFPII